MSKYEPLWKHVQADGRESFELSFEDIKVITGIDIDASIIRSKGEIKAYGYNIVKISMGDQKILFKKRV